MRGLRVLEIGSSLAGAYATRLFAAADADVVVLEPPGGAALRDQGVSCGRDATGRVRRSVWEYASAGKRSVTLPADDRRVDDLLGWAELVVSAWDGDADGAVAFHERVQAVNPAAVHLALSGYGLTGPYRNWRHSTLTEWAAGGHLYINGEPDREPVQGGGPWTSYLTGVVGAIGAAAALFYRFRTGEGQLVDVGAMESMAALHQWTITIFTHLGYVKRRWGNLLAESSHPIGLYRCSDGWISIVAVAPHQWEALCAAMELWDLLADVRLEVIGERFDRAAEIDDRINEWLASWTVGDAVEFLQRNNVPASRLLTMTEVLDEEQLAQRDYWAEAKDGPAGVRMPWQAFVIDGLRPEFRPAPAAGEHTEEVLAEVDAGPITGARPDVDLRDVRVVEFGVAWAGPLAGRFFGDLGCDVVKVEHPVSRRAVDETKAEGWRWGDLPHPQVRFPVFPDNHPGARWWNRAGMFNKMNRSKRSLCVDAKTPGGSRVLDELIGAADIVLHNYSPRGARSLGIDSDSVQARNPRAMTLSMTGYGTSGPLAANVSYGPVLQAHAGFDEATGYIGGGPVRMGVAFPDPVGGVHGAFAGLVALWNRSVTGDARSVDLSQLETLLAVAGDMLVAASATGRNPVRRGNRSVDHAPQNLYACLGFDEWVAVTVRGDGEWRRLLGLVAGGGPDGWADWDLARRRAGEPEIDAVIEAWTARRSKFEAATLLQAAGIAAFAVMTNADLVRDPQINQRGFVVTLDQPDVGWRGYPGFPIHFEKSPVYISPAPPLGGANAAVLTGVLGYDHEAVARLYADEAIFDHPVY